MRGFISGRLGLKNLNPKLKEFFLQKFTVANKTDVPTFVLFGVISIVTSTLSRSNLGDNSFIGALLLANFIAIGLIFGLLLLVIRVSTRGAGSSEVSLFSLVLFGLVIGLLKWIFTACAVAGFGYGDLVFTNPWGRIIFSSVSGVVLVPALIIFSSLRFDYSRRSRDLEEARATKGEVIPNYPDRLLGFVNDAKIRLKTSGSKSTSAQLAAEVRSIIELSLRPLSHRIWEQNGREVRRFSLSQLLQKSITKEAYFWPWIAPIWAITALSPLVSLHGSPDGYLFQTIKTLVLVLGLALASRIKVRGKLQAIVTYVMSISAIGILQILVTRSLSATTGVTEAIGMSLLSVVWLFTVSLIVGILRVFLDRAKRVDAELEHWALQETAEQSRARRLNAIRERQLAKYLHGNLQAKLSNLASHLEASNDPRDISADLDLVDKVLNEALEGYGEMHILSLEDMILQLNNDWAGLIGLTFTLAPTKINGSKLQAISEIINEGVSNAYRHGKASRASISLDSKLEVTILDDGFGPRNGTPGLGSALFDSVSSDWDITATESGSKLRIKLDKDN